MGNLVVVFHRLRLTAAAMFTYRMQIVLLVCATVL